MTGPVPATIVATVDDATGVRVEDAVLAVIQIRSLTCGCTRFSCHRPGGGFVDVTVGEHCTPVARPSPAVSPESIPA